MSSWRGRKPPGGQPRSFGTVLAMTDYRDLNRANWDDRAPAHAASATYDLQGFETDPQRLSHTVTFDRPLLGDISGLRGVHLQCHIGTDTLSLARRGARVVGVDFSPESIAQARALAEELAIEAEFVEADVLRLDAALSTKVLAAQSRALIMAKPLRSRQ